MTGLVRVCSGEATHVICSLLKRVAIQAKQVAVEADEAAAAPGPADWCSASSGQHACTIELRNAVRGALGHLSHATIAAAVKREAFESQLF